MKRAFLIVFCAAIIMLQFNFITFAVTQPATVDSVLTEPAVSLFNGTSSVTLKFYVCYIHDNIYYVNIISVVGDSSNSTFELRQLGSNNDKLSLVSNYNFNITITTYSVEDGILKNSYDAIGSRFWENWQAPLTGYQAIGMPVNVSAYYYVIPSGVTVHSSVTGDKRTNAFVRWAAEVPPVNKYNSFVSEPIADEYNRYFIFAGSKKQYLYHVHFLIQEFDYFKTMFASSPGDGYQFQLFNTLAPQVQVDDVGIEFYIYWDYNWLTYVQLGQQNIVIHYDVQITRYDLNDGTFVDTKLYQDMVLIDHPILINYTFDNIRDFDSCKFYGVLYTDQGTQYHLNLLSCNWAVDPQFVVWRDNVLDYLDRIYTIMNQQGEEVTIAQDQSGYNDMQNARNELQITNGAGQTVNAAQEVDVAFSQAAEGVGKLAPGVQSVNGMITDLIGIHPLIIVPILVALALGLVVTILGKDKSD